MYTDKNLIIYIFILLFQIVNPLLTTSEKQAMLDAHNQNRSMVNPTASNMIKLQWNETLGILAENWSSLCVFQHPSEDNAVYNSYGQNIFAAFRHKSNISYDVTIAVLAWMSESSSFVYPSSCSGTCTHTTQILWAATANLGCGKAICAQNNTEQEMIMITCQYWLRGNVVGQTLYQSGVSCSNCPPGYSNCEKNLCTYSVSTDLPITSLPRRNYTPRLLHQKFLIFLLFFIVF